MNKPSFRTKSMNIRQLILLPAVLSVLLISSCDKPPKELDEMWQCHQSHEWDQEKITDALIGKWKWEYVSCYWTPDEANGEDFLGLVIEFNRNGMVVADDPNFGKQTAIWEVVETSVSGFGLEVEPNLEWLHGGILFCDDKLLFSHSYIDGCDHYFERK